MEQQYIILRNREIPDIGQFEVYAKHGGYEGLKKAMSMKPDEVIALVKDSNLRGRGGAGFSAGMKWSFVPKTDGPKYVAVNADESEPGTFKDREILEKNPHQMIEGALICAYAIQATAIYIYIRGEFWDIGFNLEARSKRRAPPICWARISTAPPGAARSSSTGAPAHTSAARNRPC